MVNSEDIKTTENSHTYPVAEHYVRKIKNYTNEKVQGMKSYLHKKLEKQATQMEEVKSSFEFYLEDRNLAKQYIEIFSMKKSLLKKNILDWLFKKITGQGI